MPPNFTDISSLVSAPHPSPVSYGHPEKALMPSPPDTHAEHVEVHEVVEHEPESDVKPYVEPHPDKIKISQELVDVGVQSTGHTQFPSYNSVKLPISDDRVLQGLGNPISSSLRWLAEVCIFLLRRAHIRLLKAHGKAVRMFES